MALNFANCERFKGMGVVSHSFLDGLSGLMGEFWFLDFFHQN